MDIVALTHPGVTIALALALGMVGQALAFHAGVPGIVVLLAIGVLLGPDVADIVRPDVLGDALNTLVGFAVAVVLFEGGMNLDLARLRREQRAIRQLVTLGALVTAAGGALSARWIMGWDWPLAILFGTLVIVTGPTVVNPLVRRLKLQRSVATVLEAEGVLIDPIGAIVAVVALEVVLSPVDSTWSHSALLLVTRLGFGALFGLATGLAVSLALRLRHTIPVGLENVFTLSMVLVLFQLSNEIVHESGIAAVTVAGIVVGNLHIHALDELMEFKEQLTVMAIGMLFVLLAADVRLSAVAALGWGGLGNVLALMLVVRPLNVLVGTWGSGMAARQKAFMAWMAPRGIVAAAVAALFAQQMQLYALDGGEALRAMVFLVIAVTVVAAGSTGGVLAWALGLRRPSNSGWVILGANELARCLASLLRTGGQDVVLIDANAESTKAAVVEDFRVIFGDALEERTLLRAEVDTRRGVIGLTTNEGVNLLFIQNAREASKLERLLVATNDRTEGVTVKLIEESGGDVLFGRVQDVARWSERLRREDAAPAHFRLAHLDAYRAHEFGLFAAPQSGSFLALAVRTGETYRPVRSRTQLEANDEVVFLIEQDKRQEVHALLVEMGWEELPQDTPLTEETAAAKSATPGTPPPPEAH